MIEGSRLTLLTDDGLDAFKNRKTNKFNPHSRSYHKGTYGRGEPIISGEEIPIETFVRFFPKYEIIEYRGILLRQFWDPPPITGEKTDNPILTAEYKRLCDFFGKQKYHGLRIDPTPSRNGTVTSSILTKIKSAKRPKTRRENSDYLRAEADIILNIVLRDYESTVRSSNLGIENFLLARKEISRAFELMELI